MLTGDDNYGISPIIKEALAACVPIIAAVTVAVKDAVVNTLE
jgi:hypothetical protein